MCFLVWFLVQKNWKMLVVESFWVGETWVHILSCAVLPALWLWASNLTFPSFSFSSLRPGTNNTVEQSYGSVSNLLKAWRFWTVCSRLAVIWERSAWVWVWILEGASWYGVWASGTTVNYQRGCIMHLLLGLETGKIIYSCGFWCTLHLNKEVHLCFSVRIRIAY